MDDEWGDVTWRFMFSLKAKYGKENGFIWALLFRAIQSIIGVQG